MKRRLMLMYGLFRPSDAHLARLSPFADVVIAEDEATAIREVQDVEVIFGHRYLRQCLPGAARLAWVQSTAGGVDTLPCDELRRRGIVLTRVTFTAPAIARHALALAWAVNRGLVASVLNQARGLWTTELKWLPRPRRAVVFGTGPIGRGIAQLLRNDGVSVTGVKRSLGATTPPEFDHLCTMGKAETALATADWCFFALPENADTREYLNARRLALLPRHAVLVNVGRGSTIVTEDLCAALRAGELGGAGLDVVHPKPTGPNDPVWSTPQLLITPHVAAHYAERQQEMETYAEAQLARFVAGEPQENQVDLGQLP